jgi:hypothetical protein
MTSANLWTQPINIWFDLITHILCIYPPIFTAGLWRN